MLKRFLLITGVTMSVTIGPSAEAQQTTPKPQLTNQSPGGGLMVHVEGCVFPKRALSETGPVKLPFGTIEDFVLSDMKVVSASDRAKDVGGRIFKLEQVEQDRLRALMGMRVGVTGRIHENRELHQLQVVSIREITGSCPNRPAPRT